MCCPVRESRELRSEETVNDMFKKTIIPGLVVALLLSLPAAGQTPAGVTVAEPPGGLLEAAGFYIVAIVAVVSALGVCLTGNIVRMAVWLFVTLGSVALMYFLLAANFLGAIQLIIYAGGTLVLLVFGVMLTSKSPWARFDTPKAERLAAGFVCVALMASLATALTRAAWHGTEQIVPGATMMAMGKTLLTTYLVPFEVAGVLLMVVMVGAAHLARQEK